MKKYLILSVAAAVLSCLSLTPVQAEQTSATPRKFKTWTVESQKTSTTQTATTSQWKKNLAAKAAEKQNAAQAQAKVTQELAAQKQAAAAKQAAAQAKARQQLAAQQQAVTTKQTAAQTKVTQEVAAQKQAATTAKTAVTKQTAVSKSTTALNNAKASVGTNTIPSTSTVAKAKQSVSSNKNALKKAAQAKEKKNKAGKKSTDRKKTTNSKTTTATKMPGASANYSDSWHTKNTQQKLKQLGYLSEPATGKMTSATQKALEKFQKSNSLKATGKLDEATYRKVEWAAFSKNGIKNLNGTTVVREAAKYKGVKYVFGGTTPKGFDCSGYVQYVFKQLHATVTRTADSQALEGVYVTQKQLKPGDLVFFSTYEPGASHVGIYAGSGRFWNATSSRGIALCGLQEDYWRTRYYGARRVLVSNGETNK